MIAGSTDYTILVLSITRKPITYKKKFILFLKMSIAKIINSKVLQSQKFENLFYFHLTNKSMSRLSIFVM